MSSNKNPRYTTPPASTGPRPSNNPPALPPRKPAGPAGPTVTGVIKPFGKLTLGKSRKNSRKNNRKVNRKNSRKNSRKVNRH